MNVLGYFLPDSKTIKRNQKKLGTLKNSFTGIKKKNSFYRENSDGSINGGGSVKEFKRKETEQSGGSYIIVNDDQSKIVIIMKKTIKVAF